MITFDMVKNGYEAGIIKVEASLRNGIMCEIRDLNLCLSAVMPYEDLVHWNAEHIVERVFNYLKSEVKMEDYLYVKKVLDEGLKDIPVETLQDSGVSREAHVQLSHSDGTWLAESKAASSLRAMTTACEMVSKINEGTYERGQAPLRFDYQTSPELAEDVRGLVNMLGKLVEAVGMDRSALAAQIVQGNPSLAGDIYRLVDKEYYKEDIVGKLEDMKVDAESLKDEDIAKMAERFENILEHNDGYWESYWLSAEAAIDEVLKEKGKAEEEKALAWNTVDEMVDLALPKIKGVGEWAGSGLYGLRDFVVDGERMELVVEICRFEDKEANKEYYGVYYWVGYYGDDSLWADWKYTSSLDVDELKQVVRDLADTDFTEGVRKEIREDYVCSEVCDEIVDSALRTIRGIGPDMGSGCYDLKAIEIDGEKLNLYVDVCEFVNEYTHEHYYGVYYAVEYDGGDNLFSDWAYTSGLDLDALKQKVYEIANTDFTADIKKCIGKDNVDGVIVDAASRASQGREYDEFDGLGLS